MDGSVSVSPLRPLSRVASDYSSDSVVCFALEVLRPPLREIKRQLRFCFARRVRKERRDLFPFRIPRWRWSGRKLRYDKSSQRVLSTPSPLRGTTPVSGVESG